MQIAQDQTVKQQIRHDVHARQLAVRAAGGENRLQPGARPDETGRPYPSGARHPLQVCGNRRKHPLGFRLPIPPRRQNDRRLFPLLVPPPGLPQPPMHDLKQHRPAGERVAQRHAHGGVLPPRRRHKARQIALHVSARQQKQRNPDDTPRSEPVTLGQPVLDARRAQFQKTADDRPSPTGQELFDGPRERLAFAHAPIVTGTVTDQQHRVRHNAAIDRLTSPPFRPLPWRGSHFGANCPPGANRPRNASIPIRSQ